MCTLPDTLYSKWECIDSLSCEHLGENVCAKVLAAYGHILASMCLVACVLHGVS